MDISEKIEQAYRKHEPFEEDGIRYRVVGQFRIDGLKVIGFAEKLAVKPKTLEIPSGWGLIKVKEIAECAFEGADIEKVILPSSIDIIHRRAFKDCHNLRTVTLNGGQTVFDEDIFANCFNLSEIKGYGNLFLWANALHNCVGLQTIYPHIATIHANALNGCSRLLDIRLDDNASIKDDAFRDSAIRTVRSFGQINLTPNTIEFLCKNNVKLIVSAKSNFVELAYVGIAVEVV